MKVQPKLSIIIVNYNEAEYLSECFDSILNQVVNFEYEIIVGDDGSSDNSIDIIKEYESNHLNISHFVQDRDPNLKSSDVIPSLRASSVIFRAMEIANGEYRIIISGDDYFVSRNSFQKAVDFLNVHPDYSAYITNFYQVFPDGTKEYNNMISKQRFSFWYKQYIHCSCFLFRKLPKENLLHFFCDDCGIQFSICLNGKLKYSSEITFAYRQREKSIMHSANREALDIVEMLLFQDILNLKKPSGSTLSTYKKLEKLSLSHFSNPFFNLYNKKHQLDPTQYEKYYHFSKNYPNDLVGALLFPEEKTNSVFLRKIKNKMKISSLSINIMQKIFSFYKRFAQKIKTSNFMIYCLFILIFIYFFAFANAHFHFFDEVDNEKILYVAFVFSIIGILIMTLAYLCTPLERIIKFFKKVIKSLTN